jgi:hypothetical protein
MRVDMVVAVVGVVVAVVGVVVAIVGVVGVVGVIRDLKSSQQLGSTPCDAADT